MQPINLLIKPASGSCQMRCRYCFYADEMHCRETANFGIMSAGTLRHIVRKALGRAEGAVTFSFQGGEPTLAGLDFYRELIRLVRQYNRRQLRVRYALQTNGYAVTEEWAAFFRDNGFLVGVSLDGPEQVHDRYRKDAGGKGTWARVMRTIDLLRSYGVEFNILTVVTGDTVEETGRIYRFFRNQSFGYQQYIACLDPFDAERGTMPWSLTPEAYEKFLKKLFDLWYEDLSHRHYVYNRYFENLIALRCGQCPESCTLMPQCTPNYVVEADGSVYPCDFYVLDMYRLGNLKTDSFDEIENRRKETGFIRESARQETECLTCEWFGLCRGGCRREREASPGKGPERNYYCEAYRNFFPYVCERLDKAAEMLGAEKLI